MLRCLATHMARFHTLRKCVVCGIQCTPLNFVDVDEGRTCLACWTERVNPDHPDLDDIRARVQDEVKVWRCQKHTRDEYGLPDGPKSVRN